jgi:hypothetical protein
MITGVGSNLIERSPSGTSKIKKERYNYGKKGI